MTLLAVERIKLFSTKSPWWCALIALAATIGLSALFISHTGNGYPIPTTVSDTQMGYNLGLTVVMVMAALAVTTEYRFGTIRTTFQAIPNRSAVLLSKTAVVALLAGLIGEVAAFAAWLVGRLIRPNADLAINTGQQWRNVAGIGLVYAIGAIIAVAVGILVRQTAGAVAILLIYTLLAENLVQLIPNLGDKIHKWLPFNVANKFITGGLQPGRGQPVPDASLPPWWALAYFAGFAVLLLAIGIVMANRSDA